MKDEVDNVITKRLRYLRQKDKEALSSDILQLMNMHSIKNKILQEKKYLLENEVKSLKYELEISIKKSDLDLINKLKLKNDELTTNYSKKEAQYIKEKTALKNEVIFLKEKLNNSPKKTEIDILKKENQELMDKVKFLYDELRVKFDKKESQTIAFQLGEAIIESAKNPKKSIKKLPSTTTYLLKESIIRKSRKKPIGKLDKILNILLENNHNEPVEKISQDVKTGQNIDIHKNKIERKYIDINNDFSRISYDYGVNSWPKKAKKIRFISVLDEISETSWSEEFKLFRLVKKNFVEQVGASTANGLFIESCWKGNQGEWEYAFTSPGLKHQNAQNLLEALDTAKNKGLPILFWNKEDPMHYEKFLPIAEKCDIIFTTDSNRVSDYKKDLNNQNVYCLPFAANPYICNPMNRSRYDEENICFAGSYYSVGHDDRKIQMDQMLPVLLKLDGVIYDRMSKLDNERYYFPAVYQDILRDSVNFKDMTALYKHFKIFLNVNTITDSPTMMSRRVYELLACGTPVISTPSQAIEEQFPGIVQIATDAQEAEVIARDLLNNPWKHARLAHLGYREVMLHHTYESRKEIILSSLNVEYEVSEALVSIILPTMRPHFIDRIVSNIGNQTYSNIECIIITQGYSKDDVDNLRSKLDEFKNITCKVIENNSSQNLGARLNQALQHAEGEFIAKFDDDDLYFPNYLTDMMLPFKFGDWSVVGKKEGFFYLEAEDKLIVKYPNQRHIDTDFVMGATLIMRKSDLIEIGGFLEASKGEDSDLLKRMRSNGKKIYASDPFNFVVWRSSDSSSHSWDINKEFYESNCNFIGNGIPLNIVEV
ncbi:glycosyltransferase family protein [Psychrobacter sp. AOP7-A1-18]|uniref:glycosyltransferase family protein n=1 Tax=Psychrobacter sp. AOP7-A1-18 TaxID=3457647 RepID=UPI00402BC639